MIVVSDTTPLNYLILINVIDVLPELFGEVLVPPAVIVEMTRLKAPTVVQQWASLPPAWVRVVAPSTRLPSTEMLDIGEADAISLAKEHNIGQILIDERRGRRVAEGQGLITLPTLAILELAASRHLINLSTAIADLARTNFRIPKSELDDALKRQASRQPPAPPESGT